MSHYTQGETDWKSNECGTGQGKARRIRRVNVHAVQLSVVVLLAVLVSVGPQPISYYGTSKVVLL